MGDQNLVQSATSLSHEGESAQIQYPLFENDNFVVNTNKKEEYDQHLFGQSKFYKWEIVWRNVLAMAVLHGLFVYTLIQEANAKHETLFFMGVLSLISSLGVQAGAHRLWCHRSYKANFGLRLVLSLCHVLALQNDLYHWCRDHRAHHKFSDTDADPHNASRGFFFSHIGWLMVKKHPEVKRRGATLDLNDLKADPIVMYQRKYYIPMVLIIWGVIPTLIPCYFWDETLKFSFLCAVIFRYVLSLNLTWCVNSWAHIYGYRPYNKDILPVEASIRDLLLGEGFHNYHHEFPWDYSASELGPWDVYNPCTACIDFFHYMGWAWDLKKVNPLLIEKRIKSTGDVIVGYQKGNTVWKYITGLSTMFALSCVFILTNIFVNIIWIK